MARFLLICIFLFHHSLLAERVMVVHLADDSHALLLSVEQPHSHNRYHEHADQEHPELVAASDKVATDTNTPHDASTHEHPSHVHLMADVPVQNLTNFFLQNGSERQIHHSQLTGITHTPPVPPPNV